MLKTKPTHEELLKGDFKPTHKELLEGDPLTFRTTGSRKPTYEELVSGAPKEPKFKVPGFTPPFGGAYATDRSSLGPLDKLGLPEIGTAIREMVAPTTPYTEKESNIMAGEWVKTLENIGVNALTLGGLAGPLMGLKPSELRAALREDSEELAGFGPALAPAAGETTLLAIEWGYLYPKLFAAVGATGARIAKIPQVAKGLKAVKSLGGIEKVATKYPRTFNTATKGLTAFAKGATVGTIMATPEALGEELPAGEALKHISKRAALLGGVSAGFQLASTADTAIYARRLRNALIKASNQRFSVKIGEIQNTIPQGPRRSAAFKSLESLKRIELQNIDGIVSAAEAHLMGLKSGKMYQQGQEMVETPQKAAERFIRLGYLSKSAYPSGEPSLKKGLGKSEPFIKMPTTRVGEAKEAIVEAMKVARHPVRAAGKIAARTLPKVTAPAVPTPQSIITKMFPGVSAAIAQRAAEMMEEGWEPAEIDRVLIGPSKFIGDMAIEQDVAKERARTAEQIKADRQQQADIDEMDRELRDIQIPTETTETPATRGVQGPQQAVAPLSVAEVAEIPQIAPTAKPEADISDEEASGVTKRERSRLIRETAEQIKQSDIYQTALEAQGRQAEQIGGPGGMVYINKSAKGEVDAAIQNHPILKFHITYDKSKGGASWDQLVQRGMFSEREGEYFTGGEMDIGEFLERYGKALESGREVGGVNIAALEQMEGSELPTEVMLAQKHRMLMAGSSDQDINEMITEWAEGWGIDPEAVEGDYIKEYGTRIKQIKRMEDPDVALEQLATEQIEAEDRRNAVSSAKEVLEANDITAEVEEVEEIRPVDLLDRPVLEGGAAGKQRGLLELGLEFTQPEVKDPDQLEFGQLPAKPTQITVQPKKPINTKRVVQLRRMADTLDKQIKDKRREMTQNPTPKRMREYYSRIHDADNLERTQKAMRAMADSLESGTLPSTLEGVTKKADIASLVYKGLLGGGYYEVNVDPEYRDKSDTGQTLQKLIEEAETPEATAKKAERERVQEIQRAEEKFRFLKIPGFFPTPTPVAILMVDDADIQPGMKVLEPSAGKGDIADEIKRVGVMPDVVEIIPSLQNILKLKGYNVVGDNFLEMKAESPAEKYDRIVMNPPFEKGQDQQHVKHAYDLLKPGGKLVSIMSEGSFTRSQKKDKAFQGWFDNVGGESVKLGEKSFQGKESFRQTGIAGRIVTIERDQVPFERRGKPVGAAITQGEKQVILLAYGADSETGYHEGYHILRRRLTEKSTKVLDKYFKGDEEAEATAFAGYVKTGKTRTFLRGIWQKLRNVLRKVKSGMMGRGFKTAEDIFGQIERGTVEKQAAREGIAFERADSYWGRPELKKDYTPKPYVKVTANIVTGKKGDKIEARKRTFWAEPAELKENRYVFREVTKEGDKKDTFTIANKEDVIKIQQALNSKKYGELEVIEKQAPAAPERAKFETSGEKLRRDAEKSARIKARKARLAAQHKIKVKKIPKVSRARIRIKLQDHTPPLRADLVDKAPPDIGPALTEQPPPSKARTPTQVILDEKFYEENRKKYRRTVREAASEIVSEKLLGFDKIAAVMSSRLGKIDEGLKYAVRRYAFNTHIRTTELIEGAKPMTKALKKFNKADKRAFKFATLNGQGDKINELVDKYKIHNEYQQFREVLDEIFEAGNEVGLEILYRGEYWPRVVKNLKGLLKYLQTTDKWAPIQQALFKRQEQAGGRELTEAEKAQVINTLLRGFRIGGVSLSRPGATKERTIDIFDNQIEPYYHDLADGLQIYIQRMAQAIGAREFFGKQTSEIQKLRANRSRLATRLHKTSQRIGYRKTWTEEKYDTHISEARKKLQEVNAELEKRKTQTLEDSVGWYVKDLVLSGKITPQQQIEIAQMFKGIFEPKGMSGSVRTFTKLAYIDVLANVPVAMTQLEELGLSVYKSKIRALPAAVRAGLGKSEIKLADMGVTEINQYMTDLGFEELGNKMLFMMRTTDMLGKQTFVNTTVGNFRAEAKRKNLRADFVNKMRKMFGDEYKQVIDDLKNDRVTENVKFLAFNELADFQPIAITETPEYYARGGNWRILYMLRSFTIRRFDFLRNEARKMMVNPAKEPKQFVKGLTNMVQLLTILTAFGVGKDVLRAWFLGKPFDLEDSVIDNILQYVLLSRYTAMRTGKEGLGSAVAQEIVPPTKGIDALIHDVRKGEIDRTVRSIPVIGENYYWWFGGGSEDEQESAWVP